MMTPCHTFSDSIMRIMKLQAFTSDQLSHEEDGRFELTISR